MKAKVSHIESENHSSIGEIFKKYNIRPDKRLGQHFLVDKNIIKKEVELAGIKPDETILEIGPGLGFLTKDLLCRAKHVIAIELDARMAEVLESECGCECLKIIRADALDVDFPAFDRCVSNIPYEISSQIIAKLGRYGNPAILIMQKEFAERLAAKPKDKIYSRISVLSQYYFNAELLGAVSKNSFFPAPKVDSAIVRLIPRTAAQKKALGVEDEEFFFAVARALFQHKNQSIRNAFIHSRGEFGLEKDAAKIISGKFSGADRKVDSLSIKELAEIAGQVRKSIALK